MERNLSVELRPQQLDDFIGNEEVIGSIKEGIKQGRVYSTYVIAGPPGTGKTSLARAIIKYVNGKQDYYDIIEPGSSDLGADDIRPLIADANLAPQWGKYKGIIIDEAHKLVASTQTILLKATEEPCYSTIWFICSSEPSKLSDALRRRGSFNLMKGLTSLDQIAKVITRACDHVGGKIGTEYSNRWGELATALQNNEITSPGLIIQAVEKWITGAPASIAAQVSETSAVDTFAVAKEVAKGNWSGVQKLLQSAPRSAARDIRSAVAGYFRSILMKEASGTVRAQRCVWAIERMAELSNQNQYEDGLIFAATCAALYNICVGQALHINKKV